jgi:DNA-binding NarL/FixJ family response regulator
MVIETVLVDDEPLARRKLRELLQRGPEALVIGEASSGSEAVRPGVTQNPKN